MSLLYCHAIARIRYFVTIPAQKQCAGQDFCAAAGCYRGTWRAAGRGPVLALTGTPRIFLCPGTLEYFQADAASVYDQLLQTGSFTEAGCWSHARRYWFDAIAGAPLEAAHVLGEIRLLYRIEDEIKEGTAEQRRCVRQARSTPIVARLYGTFAEWETAALPKSPMGQALTYFRNQREALHRYLFDGRLDIDNNDCEREFRYVATGRRNWLFVGSERGARAFAVHLTMVRNCAPRGINPLEYYSDVLRRIPVQPRDRLEELLPANWKAGPALPDRIVMPAMYSTDRAPPR